VLAAGLLSLAAAALLVAGLSLLVVMMAGPLVALGCHLGQGRQCSLRQHRARSAGGVDEREPARVSGSQESIMNTRTLLIIVIILLVLGGGGYYGQGRWF
jgi:hypothetical protein